MSRKILVTADQIATSSTGLYHFAFELIKQLRAYQTDEMDLQYLIPRSFAKIKPFGEVHYRTRGVLTNLRWKSIPEFDLIHFTQQNPTLLKPHKIIGRKILTIHDLNYRYEYPVDSAPYRHFQAQTRRYMDQVDGITTISHYAARDISEHLQYPLDQIRVIYNGVNVSTIPAAELAQHQPSFRPERPFLFTVGTVMAKKNFHVLPALLAHLDYDLIIAGRIDDHSLEYYNLIKRECERFGIAPGRVHLLGETSEIDKHWYYQHCSAFVFPSIAEGFGLPVLEAFSYEKPTFLSTHTALPEVGGEAAYYFDSFHPDRMSEVVKQGLADFPSSNKIQLARNRVSEFSWEKAAQSYLTLYEEILR